MSNKIKIKLENIEVSLLMPLWSRAKLTRENNPLINDPLAVSLVDHIDYDFSELDKRFSFRNNLLNCARAKHFDDKLRSYIAKHPKASIVNVGAGLDTTFSRIDNGLIQWYDLDLPDVIKIREELIPGNDRVHLIRGTIFDPTWYKCISEVEGGVFLISGGVLIYFKESEVRSFINSLADNLPGAEIVFDAISRWGVLLANLAIRRTGLRDVVAKWALRDAGVICKWDKRIRVLDQFPFFTNVSREPAWGKGVKRFMDSTDRHKVSNIVHLGICDSIPSLNVR
jgi:O-methyltransferase involved in polyketide biosynthesis